MTTTSTAATAADRPRWHHDARRLLTEVDEFVRLEWPTLDTPGKAVAAGVAVTAAVTATALVLGGGWITATVLGTLLGLAGRLGLDAWNWLQATRPWDTADRLAHLVSDPVRHYLTAHSDALPFTPGALFTAWWVTGLLLFIAAGRRPGLTGRTVAWTVWTAVTTATVWAGTHPASRWTATAICALLLTLASLTAHTPTRPLTPTTRPRSGTGPEPTRTAG
ncbi:hypothetical protein ACFVXH_39675 [Kitasatospora sp. NPDC058184]|uniref:hypothetical protein n=1 Tax=Kitasatospora sp. NPDC058184 TaxID=3346370 RepID=UPI0036D94F2D